MQKNNVTKTIHFQNKVSSSLTSPVIYQFKEEQNMQSAEGSGIPWYCLF